MTVGSLFSGIGGFDLGFQRAGFQIVWQVELDPWCRAVLAKHWPAVTRYADVRDCHGPYVSDAERPERWPQAEGRHDDGHGHDAGRQKAASRPRKLRDDDVRRTCLVPVDVICGGFPCQPHSLAGRRAGANDERDLWPETIRIIREVQPRWIVLENVPGLLTSDAGRFFRGILWDLASSGFDAEWDHIPASAVGAPHRRDRVWIVGYPKGEWEAGDGFLADVADAARGIRQRETSQPTRHAPFSGEDVADTDESRSRGRIGTGVRERPDEWTLGPSRPRIFTITAGLWREWEPESGFRRVAHGIPARVDRLRGLGNAIVPAIAQWIAERIKDAEGLDAD